MTVAEFFSMGGFGYYVWMSMGMTFLLMMGEVITLKKQRKVQLKQVSRMVRIGKNKQ